MSVSVCDGLNPKPLTLHVMLMQFQADFGFALLMATARRVAESEHYLRAGLWTKWRYDM